MNKLEQALAVFGPKTINQRVMQRKMILLKKAIKPEYNSPFNKAYHYRSFVSDSFCQWLINKAEDNGEWTTKRHDNYPTTDIPVSSILPLKIPIYNFVTINILPLIAEHYTLNIYFLNIVDLFIVKYDVNGQDHLEFHRDGSIISFNILLNEEFTGGGTIIEHVEEDGSLVKKLYVSDKGDLFIHPGKLLHSGNKIKSGVRYILVGFIDFGNRIS